MCNTSTNLASGRVYVCNDRQAKLKPLHRRANDPGQVEHVLAVQPTWVNKIDILILSVKGVSFKISYIYTIYAYCMGTKSKHTLNMAHWKARAWYNGRSSAPRHIGGCQAIPSRWVKHATWSSAAAKKWSKCPWVIRIWNTTVHTKKL